MKAVWVCIWFALGAAELGLGAWFHSTTFLLIGLVPPLMVAFNLQRVHAARRSSEEALFESA